MSKLMGLFASSESDGNDSLRYSAPKEPKKKIIATKGKEIVPIAPEDSASQQQKATAPASSNLQVAPSKVLASASVRLFRMNTSTQSHEPIENGSMLGCVIMGSNGSYQLLIYNGQKVPLALVSLSVNFEYVIQDLYLSFYDSTGNYFSVLFDSISIMSDFVRMVAGCIVHSLSFVWDEEIHSITRSLPQVSQTQSDEIALSSGMTAGLHINVWEMEKSYSYPTDIFAKAPLKSATGEEVVKFKLLNSDNSIILNMIDTLVGRKKGDRYILGLSPILGAKSTWITTSKQYENAWFLFECEIAKVKSSANAEIKINEDHSTSDAQVDGDITARIARIAAKAGNGGSQLAMILKSKDKQNQAVGENEVLITVEADRGVSLLTNRIIESKERIESTEVDNSTATTATSSAVVVKAETRLSDPPKSVPCVSVAKSLDTLVVENTPPREIAMTFRDNTKEFIGTSTSHNIMQSPQFVGHHADTAFSTSFHQSMMIVQQSIMQLHTKMDQMSMQVNNSYQLQQKMDHQSASPQNLSFPQYGMQSNMLNSTFAGCYPMNQFASPNFMFSNPYLSMNPKFSPGLSSNNTPIHFVQRKEEILQKFQSFIEFFDLICIENQEVKAKLESGTDHSPTNYTENKRLSIEIEGLQKKLSTASAELSNLKHELENLEDSKVVQAFVSQKLLEERKHFDMQFNSTLRENMVLKDQLKELSAKHESLQVEFNAHKSLLDESSVQLGLKTQENQVLHAKLTDGENGEKRYNNDELNEMLRNIFVRSSEQFVTSEDLSEIEDEKLQTVIKKTSKSNLKRLRDVLSEVSESIHQ